MLLNTEGAFMLDIFIIVSAIVLPLVFYMDWRFVKLQESIDTAGTLIGEVAEILKEQRLGGNRDG
jgi:hypothetical protein